MIFAFYGRAAEVAAIYSRYAVRSIHTDPAAANLIQTIFKKMTARSMPNDTDEGGQSFYAL